MVFCVASAGGGGCERTGRISIYLAVYLKSSWKKPNCIPVLMDKLVAGVLSILPWLCVWSLWATYLFPFIKYIPTVRLLTHVHCKPTHFFFHSFLATMSYTLQTSFNSLMKDWADKYMYGVPPRGHLQGQTRDNSNTLFFTLKRNT